VGIWRVMRAAEAAAVSQDNVRIVVLMVAVGLGALEVKYARCSCGGSSQELRRGSRRSGK
jgi:hypothetical protein